MTLLKDSNYKNINIALLSLENDIKNKTFDTSAINRQLEEINERIDEINAGSNSNSSNSGSSGDADNSAEINDLRAEVENINSEIDAINSDIDDIEQKLSKIFSAENYVEDFNTAIAPGVYYWTTNTANRPNNYGVLLVNRSKDTSDWINQIAYSTSDKIYFRQKINDLKWTGWRTIAYEDVTRTNADAGYLCKYYYIDGYTYQAWNVILLGKIPDPASTAAPATPSTSWDIDVDFYFVRSQGHKASWCNVKAGYGYSNAWRKYGFIETFGVDASSSYNNPFYLVTVKYNNEWYIGVKHCINIDGNYDARVHNVNIAGGRNPSTVGNTPLANMFKAISYLKTDGTVLNSEINSSIVEMPNTYAPTIQTTSSLVLRNTTDLSLSSFGQEPLSIGTVSSENMGIDSNEIQARYNGKVSPLYINGSGGKVVINDTNNSNGGLQVGGNTTLQSSSTVGLPNFGLEPLSIGDKTGKNIGIDGDDIQARNNGAAAALDLNYFGGLVRVNGQGLDNGGLQVGGRLNIPTIAPSSPLRGDIWLVL